MEQELIKWGGAVAVIVALGFLLRILTVLISKAKNGNGNSQQSANNEIVVGLTRMTEIQAQQTKILDAVTSTLSRVDVNTRLTLAHLKGGDVVD